MPSASFHLPSPSGHVFDTALAKPIRTIVMEGAIAALTPLLKTEGGYLHAVLPYGGVVRSWTDVDGCELLYKTLEGQAPAIAVALGGRDDKPAGVGGYGMLGELEVLIYHVSDHARDLVSGRQIIDDVGVSSVNEDPGLHIIMEHARELLVGQRFGVAGVPNAQIKQVRPEREDELLTRENLTVWLQTYRLTISQSVKQYRDATQLLDSIRVRTTQEDGEATLPSAATKPTTIDAYTDDLPP